MKKQTNSSTDNFESIDILDPDDVEILDAVEYSDTETLYEGDSSGALVPYHSNVPALIAEHNRLPALIPGSLGDLESYIRAANLAPILSADEERDLALRLRNENDLAAAQKLVFSHLRLVVSIARGYLGYGLSHADLIQEGNIGLMKAIKRYDPDKGARLMTFAVHWIRSEIQDYIIKNWRQVKMATTKNQRKLFFNLRHLKKDDKCLNADEANAIADKLNVKPDEVYDMEMRLSGGDTPIDGPDNKDDDDKTYSPSDWLTNESDTPTAIIEQKDTETLRKQALSHALAQLDDRSRRVIEARWLTEDSSGEVQPMTLQELAAELNVSAERIRQIEKKALGKMRSALSDFRID